MKDDLPVLTAVRPLKNYRLHVRFSDGTEGDVDLSEFAGKGVFALWNDYSRFEKVAIGSGGELVWNDEVDMDGLGIYLKLTGKKPMIEQHLKKLQGSLNGMGALKVLVNERQKDKESE